MASQPTPVQRLASSQEQSVYIVQFFTQPLEEYRQVIRQLGGQVHFFMANHAHLVQMSEAVKDALAAKDFVRWIGPYHPSYRLEEYMLVNIDQADQFYPLQKYNIMLFHSEMEQKNAVAGRIAKLGGRVERAHAGKYLMEAILTPEQLFEVAKWDEVLFIDRWTPGETDMDLAREIGGANFLETMEGFTGQGVRGEVLDTGFNTAHVDFGANPLIEHTAVGSDSHGAATSGIVFGDGTGNPMGRGLLPDGQGIIAAWSAVSVGQPRYDHTGELVQSPYFAVFQTASVGSGRTFNYTNISADTDAALFDFDIVHLQSQSNAGNQDSRPQAWAKNIISGGGLMHRNTLDRSDDCWCNGASIGPASDGRIKPDLSSFYDDIFTVTTGSPTSYTSGFGGTSGATPIVAGHIGLFFQMWHEGVFGNTTDPGQTVFENKSHMTTAKAMLINTAFRYDFTGQADDLTRVHQGWGMPDLEALYGLRDRMIVVDETDVLTNMQVATYSANVLPGEAELKVTMTYADPPGVPSAAQHRINDLNLKVTAPDATVYWGNNGLLDGNFSTPGGTANEIDTVENVFIANPAEGSWTVEVIANEINEDGHVETGSLDADFALVITGAVSGPGFTLNADPVSAEICAPGDHVVNLDIGQILDFKEEITLSASDVPAGASVDFSQDMVMAPASITVTISGLGSVAPGEYSMFITGTSASVTKSIFVHMNIADAAPAGPGNIAPFNGAESVGLNPTVTWDMADQAVDYTVEVADDPGFANVVFTETTTALESTVETRLDPLTCYYWRVRGRNACGDGAWSGAGFMTLDQPDYFTQQFTSNIDLANMTLSFIPDGSGNYYRACIDNAVAFPVDPTGGTAITLSDDDFEQITPAMMVNLYGTDYASLFVSSNGFITFNSGATTTGESLATHFNQPRVSMLFDDLNPAVGGSVSYRELADQLVVTYENVPEFNTSNSNSFQVAFHQNGEIHITWLGLDAGDGLMGLSRGDGLPGDFLASDLSAYGSCAASVATRGGACLLADCEGDLNNDNVVDMTDLGLSIEDWHDTNGLADLNGNGIVDVGDLVSHVDVFGPCPE